MSPIRCRKKTLFNAVSSWDPGCGVGMLPARRAPFGQVTDGANGAFAETSPESELPIGLRSDPRRNAGSRKSRTPWTRTTTQRFGHKMNRSATVVAELGL